MPVKTLKSKRVVIANSIGRDSQGFYIIHSPSRWSSGVRAENHFTYYPWELAYLSSLLKRDTDHQVSFIDGNLQKLNWKELSEEILRYSPQYLIMEPSTRTITEDLKCALRVKEKLGTSLILCGQHASALPAELLSQGVDFVVSGEYEKAVLQFFRGKEPRDLPGFYPNPPGELIELDSLPFPEDEDVSRIDYAIPGEPSSDYIEIQAYASRGCPRSCNFCVSRHLYYRRPVWRKRKVENILREIIYLKEKYPRMQGIFFDEECHNGSEDFILELCREMVKEGLNTLKFEAMCDAMLLSRSMLRAMREAGYYQIRVGIESGSEKVLKGINKSINLRKLEEILHLAKELGMLAYGTFIVGAPASSQEEDLKTVKYIKYLLRGGLLDKLQVSILTPQPGTPFYAWSLKNNYLSREDFSAFDGERKTVVSYPHYPSQCIERMKEMAVKVRDRELLWKNIRRGNVFSWIGRVFRKHGVRKGLKKAYHRLQKAIFLHRTSFKF